MPLVGTVVRGIAGAYSLGAIAEAGAIPELSLLVVAMVYAGLWMEWAGRYGWTLIRLPRLTHRGESAS